MRKLANAIVIGLCLLAITVVGIGFASGSYRFHFRDSIAHQRHKAVAPALYITLLAELSILAQRFVVPSLDLVSSRG